MLRLLQCGDCVCARVSENEKYRERDIERETRGREKQSVDVYMMASI